MKPIFTIGAAATLALALSACELRRDGDEDQAMTGEDATTPDPMASPTPTQSASPVASIIRDDTAPEEESVVLPVQPVEISVPFPDGSDISAAAERRLAGLMNQAAIEEEWPVRLSGHTDSGGNDQANLRASRARAEAVAAWLVERGVDDERIEIIAFGEQNPIAPNAKPDGTPNEEGRRRNRRVEISVMPEDEDTDGDAETPAANAETDQDA